MTYSPMAKPTCEGGVRVKGDAEGPEGGQQLGLGAAAERVVLALVDRGRDVAELLAAVEDLHGLPRREVREPEPPELARAVQLVI